MRKTAVVILNWNTEDYLRRFLPALLESCEGMDAEVVVADSASSDGSLRALAEEFPAVRAIPLDANYGFTGGYNRALAQVEAEYYVLLNSDIEVPRGWLRPLVEWMDSHPDCGVCGPKLHKLIPSRHVAAVKSECCSVGYKTNGPAADSVIASCWTVSGEDGQMDGGACKVVSGEDGQMDGGACKVVSGEDNQTVSGQTESKGDRLECVGSVADYTRSSEFEYAGAAGGWLDRYGYPFCRGRVLKRTAADEGQYDRPQDVMWVSGACLMTRASLWRELGGLDDRFFAHMEEIDYCWRAQLAGWRVTVVPESVVYHIGGGTLPQESPFKLKLNYRNNLLLLDNNLAATIGPWRARCRIAVRKVLDLGSALVYLLTGRAACCKAVLDAHREYRTLRCARQHSAEVRPEWLRLHRGRCPLTRSHPLRFVRYPCRSRATDFAMLRPALRGARCDAPGAERLSQNVVTEGTASVIADGQTPAASVNADGQTPTASVNAAAADERRARGGAMRGNQVAGLLPVRILLQAAIRKDKIFNYLTRYEDSH